MKSHIIRRITSIEATIDGQSERIIGTRKGWAIEAADGEWVIITRRQAAEWLANQGHDILSAGLSLNLIEDVGVIETGPGISPVSTWKE